MEIEDETNNDVTDEDDNDLKEAVEKSSKENRNFLFAALILFTYVFITVNGTDDLNLLMLNSKVKLPTISAEVPLLMFYWIISFAVLIFHANILVNLYFHSRKLNEWINHAKKQDILTNSAKKEKELSMFPFIFNYRSSVVDRDVVRWTLRFITWVIYYFYPLFILFWIGKTFLPYHDKIITGIHNIIFAVDFLILAYFWPNIVKPTESKPIKFFLSTGLTGLIRNTGKYYGKHILFAVLLSIFVFNIVSVPVTNDERLLLPFIKEVWIPFKSKEKSNWDSPKKVNYEEEIKGETFFKPIFKIKLSNIVNRNLYLPEIKPVVKNKENAQNDNISVYLRKLNNDYVGVYLRGRNLDFGNFNKADLSYSDLREASLRGADLNSANLQGANLNESHLQGANIRYAHLQGADLTTTEMQGAALSDTELQGADLRSANLQGANLINAVLQGAYLFEAHLQGADLSSAKLQGAFLDSAELQGSDLYKAELQGTYLPDAKVKCIYDNETQIKDVYYESKVDVDTDDNWTVLINKFSKLKIANNTDNIKDAQKRLEKGKNKCIDFDKDVAKSIIEMFKRGKNYESFIQFNVDQACNGQNPWKENGVVIFKNEIMIAIRDKMKIICLDEYNKIPKIPYNAE
ncbi:MAG: pentapeptide repeat-containing protein [Nitrospirae bacterium]|nr:pentapeptide repeat-containing protein [Nitrospirota bacterium]MBF0534350.1 pentapeptide repeat-containing protein [Nitrospirota bacterium]MBF0615669.1 pentapeptide repeat-containing protein [Nitrospirota bacterium]